MISFIKGALEQASQGRLVVENAMGVGYEILTNNKTISTVKDKIGETVKVYTYLHVKEDIMKLYGFMSMEENNFFKLLISVNGVGPSSALNILEVDAQQFCIAIINSDDKALAKMKIKGVGGKTAERLIVELKTKIKDLIKEDSEHETVQISSATFIEKKVYEDAKTALMALGYSATDAKQTIEQCYTEKMEVEEVIRKTLRYIAVQKNI